MQGLVYRPINPRPKLTPDEVLNSYTEGYKIQCLEDSQKYAPYDDENYVAPHLDSLAIDSLKSLYFLQVDWRQNLQRTLLAYRWQFSMSKATYVENVAAFLEYELSHDSDPGEHLYNYCDEPA